jgi:hypothetical protein
MIQVRDLQCRRLLEKSRKHRLNQLKKNAPGFYRLMNATVPQRRQDLVQPAGPNQTGKGKVQFAEQRQLRGHQTPPAQRSNVIISVQVMLCFITAIRDATV